MIGRGRRRDADKKPRALVLRATNRRHPLNRFWRNRFAVAGTLIIICMGLVALISPLLVPSDPSVMAPLDRLVGPSREHPLGTDSFGRDVLSRMIYGARVSLPVALFVVAILSTVGVVVGISAAYYGRMTDSILMRLVDMMMSIPDFVMILTVIGLFGRGGVVKTMVVIGLTSWMGMARLVRGQALVAKTQDYVLAARALGSSDLRIIGRHLIPYVTSVIMVNATLWVAIAIVLESSLSYLGLGIQPPTPSWGNMLNEGRRYMAEAWWLTVFPGAAIFLTAMSFNVVGDGLRDALDLRSSG